ncbi:MAG: ABC transporter substrate-binding protein [Desulfonatronovibrio sp.]
MENSNLCSRWAMAAVIVMLLLVLGVYPALAKKDTLVLAVGGENAEGYDPLLGWGSYGNPLFQSTLLKRDADLNIVPDLAKSWELSEDRIVWTVTIRDDIKFSDGTALTAKDVAFTFNKGLETGGKIDLSPLKKAEAIDKTTIKLTLAQPDITFIHHLITLGIVPEKLYGPEYGRNPVGSGPYKLVRWDEGQQMVVEANELYYGKQPEIKRLVFLFSEEDAALAAAKARKVDVLGVPSSLAGQDIPAMRLHVVKSVDNRGLMFPTVPNKDKTTPKGVPIGNDVTADAAIRKAVNYAIHRQALVEGVLNGYGRPAFGVVDDLPWDNPQIRFKDNDLEKAGKILDAAEWVDADGDGIREKEGLKAEFTIVYNAKDSLRQGLALAVSDMLKPVGINAIPKGENWDRIKTQLTHTHVVVYGFGDHSPLEMYKLYHTPGPEPMYWNAGFYSNPVVDKHLENARAAETFEASIPHWQKAQWDGETGFTVPGDAAWAWMVNLDHTYFVNKCLDVGKSQMEPHGHGWPITANINEWTWTCD